MKRNYYAKFVGLPGKYDFITCANIKLAKAHFARYRDDAIVYAPEEVKLSFDDYHNQVFSRIEIKQFPQTAYAIGKLFDGSEDHYLIEKNQVLNSIIKNYLQYVPGIKKAQIFELVKGTYNLTVKKSPALIEFVSERMQIDPKVVEKQMPNAFPVFIFKIKDKLPKEKEMTNSEILAIEV